MFTVARHTTEEATVPQWVLLELLDDFFENFPYKFSYARKPEKTVQ